MQASQLFNEIPLSFFRPLSGRFPGLYWTALETLYTLDFEGEPFEITRELAIEQVALVIEQSPEYSNVPDELKKELETEITADVASAQNHSPDPEAQEPAAESEREARKFARFLLKRLEVTGWFDYEYRQSQKGYVLNFRDYAARILQTLTQVAKQEQPIFEGLAQSIKAALSPQELEDKPGAALYNAQRATKDLVREIKILSRNIHRYSDRVLKQSREPKELLELQLDIYQEKVVDANYHRFKTSDNIFRYRSFVLAQLDRLEENAELHASAVQWVAKNQAVDYATASSRVDEWTGVIRAQLLSIHLLTDDLDRKNSRYTAATLQKISYLLNQDHLLEGKLVGLIESICNLPENNAWAFVPPLACFHVQIFDPASLYVPPRERAPVVFEGVPIPDLASDKRKGIIEKTRKRLGNQYSRSNVYRLAEALLKGSKTPIRTDQLALNAPEDLIRLIFFCLHGRERRAPFTFTLPDLTRVRATIGRFDVPVGELAWKEGK